MGVPIHGEPQPDDGWMYSLLLLRIHRACPSAATAVVGRWAIGLGNRVDPSRCEAWLLNALYSSCTLGAPLLRRGRVRFLLPRCRTLHGVSQQRTTVLSLLAFAFVGVAVKLNLLVPFDQAAEAWTQRHITRLHTTLMLTVTELVSIGFVSVVTGSCRCDGSPEIRLLARQARPERAWRRPAQ
jgi:hypothetical protein